MENKVLYLLLCCAFFACQDKKMLETKRIIKEWTGGKTIYIPDISPSYWRKNADIPVSVNDCEYKILNYIDSTGCTNCLHMDVWKSYIEEMGHSVNFLFYFNSKDKRRILLLLRKERFENY
ncbi:MAG: hypothetical protein LBD59_11430, partial [Prevotellaceae bacterium]|nr:hypothetical protein [Prevotellaceae bacterium]